MIWLTDQHMTAVSDRLAAGEPWATGIVAWAKTAIAADWRPDAVEMDDGDRRLEGGPERMIAGAITALFGDEPTALTGAVALFEWFAGGAAPKDLGAGIRCLVGAQLHDAACRLGDAEAAARIRPGLAALVEQLRHRVSQGNPHQVGNNWWAITHSGCLLGALALDGADDGAGGVYAMDETIAWCQGRILAFAQHFGDAGLYHEGIGYQSYTISHLLPALEAVSRLRGVDLFARLPNLQRIAVAMYASSCARYTWSDSGPGRDHFRAKVSWNDDGPGFGGHGGLLIAADWAPAERRGGLRTWIDRLHGHEAGDPDWCAGYGGALLALLFYPADVDPADPDASLPLAVHDSRQGLGLYRSGYRDADDCILGVYARTTFVSGHSQQDTGSVRFMAHGHDWVIGGGQARGKAEWQSRVLPDGTGKDERQERGTVMWAEGDRQGAVWACDLRRASVGYHERYVATRWPTTPGGPALLALLDQVDDHAERSWTWRLSFEPGLQPEVHADGAGVSLRAEDGRIGVWRFVGDQPERIELDAMPGSVRTYSGGARVEYDGRPFIRAHFAPKAPLGIYAVLTVVQGGDEPVIERGDGLDLVIDGTPWQRPFGVAIPADFVPGVGRGLCRWPDGVV